MKGKNAARRGGSVPLLALSNVACRVLGFLFKVPLSNLVGSVGMGYFALATQVFGVAAVPATGGMPVILSADAARRQAAGESGGALLKSVRPLFWLVGAVCAAAAAAAAPAICRLSGTPEAVRAVWTLCPAVLFTASEHLYRAWFQGRGELGAGAAAQLTEALFKLAVGTAGAWLAHRAGQGVGVVAAGAAAGVTAGNLVSALVLRGFARRRGGLRRARRERGAAKSLARRALPVTLGAAAGTVLSALDAVVILKRLAFSGAGVSGAAGLYGAYTGYAVTVYALPYALTGAVTAWAAPRAAAAFCRGDRAALGRDVGRALRAVTAVSLPAACLYALMPERLIGLFFSRADAAAAVPLLALLSASVVLWPLAGVFSASLQAMGLTRVPVIASLASGLVKIGCNWFLVGRPEIGIRGAPIAAALSYAVLLIPCAAAFFREVRPRSTGSLAGAGASAALAAVCGAGGAWIARSAALGLEALLPGRAATLAGLAAGGAAYLGAMALTGQWKKIAPVRKRPA